jgi:hypothetical protein
MAEEATFYFIRGAALLTPPLAICSYLAILGGSSGGKGLCS